MLRLSHILLMLLSFIPFSANASNNVQETTLKNGLKVIVKEDHRSPVAVFMIWYKVGSAYEPPGLTGISHVLEHMMFKGTKQHPPGQFTHIIAENGGMENAFTSTDYTAYYQMLAVDRLPLSFKLEADRMKNLLLDKELFAKEIQVVKEERRMRTDDNPQGLTYERFLASAHLAYPYQHPPVGWMSDLDNLKVSDLREWYQHWYSPNNAIVVVVGDVKPQAVFKLANQYFANIQPSVVPALRAQTEPPPLGRRHVKVATPAKLPWVVFGFNVPSFKTATEAWEPYALDVLAAILDGGKSARIEKNIIRQQQIASEAGAGYDSFALYPTLFIFTGTPSKDRSVKELQRALLAQVKTLQNQVVSDDELQRVKNQAIAQKIYNQDSLIAQGIEIGSLESIGVPWHVGENYVDTIRKVTPQQVQAVAKKYLVPERLTTAILKPLPIDPHKPQVDAAPGIGGSQHVR